jgi:hypothetical protein
VFVHVFDGLAAATLQSAGATLQRRLLLQARAKSSGSARYGRARAGAEIVYVRRRVRVRPSPSEIMIRSPMTRTVLLVAFLAAGLLLVRSGALSAWLWMLLTLVVIATRVIARMDAYQDELSFTDEGVTRQHGSKLRKVQSESVRWDEVQRVEVLTHETGPGRKDLLFLLHGVGDAGVAVPGPVAERHGLLAELRRRFPGLQEDQWSQAQAASGRASFLLWERAAA